MNKKIDGYRYIASVCLGGTVSIEAMSENILGVIGEARFRDYSEFTFHMDQLKETCSIDGIVTGTHYEDPIKTEWMVSQYAKENGILSLQMKRGSNPDIYNKMLDKITHLVIFQGTPQFLYVVWRARQKGIKVVVVDIGMATTSQRLDRYLYSDAMTV